MCVTALNYRSDLDSISMLKVPLELLLLVNFRNDHTTKSDFWSLRA